MDIPPRDGWDVLLIVAAVVAAIGAVWAVVSQHVGLRRSRTIITIYDPWFVEVPADPSKVEVQMHVHLMPPGAWRLTKQEISIRTVSWLPWKRRDLHPRGRAPGLKTQGNEPYRGTLKYRFKVPDTDRVKVRLTIGLEPSGRKTLRKRVEIPPPDERAPA